MNSKATPNTTSSPALAFGASRSAKPDGAMTVRSGPAPARASLSARQAKAKGLLTSGTYGPPSSISSSSARLQSSLENRLRVKTASLGSTLCRLIWKARVTPSGRSIPALRASARRTGDNGSIGSDHLFPLASARPTPTGRDWKGATHERWGENARPLNEVAVLASWPTPTAKMAAGGEYADADKAMARALGPHANDLRDFAQLAGWPTPTKGNADGSQMAKDASPTGKRPDGSKATVSLNQVAVLSGWPTPMAGTPKSETYNQAGNNDFTRKTAFLAGAAIKGANIAAMENWPGPARLTASGELLTGCSAAMASGGRLNPAHSLWLMLGPFAIAWARCAEAVTLSISPRRRVSLKLSSTASAAR